MSNIKSAVAALALAVSLACLATPASATTVYDLEQAVQRALEANPSMEAARHQYLGAEEGRKAARGAFLPSATVTYGYTRYQRKTTNSFGNYSRDNDVWAATFNIHQPLFAGFNILSNYQKAELTKENAEANVRNAELSLTTSVQQNFLGLLKAREDVRSAEDSVTRLKEQLKVTQAFYDVGLKPRLDVLQAEVDLARAEDTLIAAQNDVATQTVRLNTLLNLDLDADVDYQGDLNYQPFTMEIDEALETAYKDRPDLYMAAKSVDIAVKDKKITDSAFYPQVGFDYDWSTYGNRPIAHGDQYRDTDVSEYSLGVTASWKFWEWGATYYASRQAGENVSALLRTADNTRQEATYEVKVNHLAIRKAAESIRVNKKALEAAQESYRMAKARYQAQVGTNTDVLDAQERLTVAEASLTAALADYKIALSKLYASIGKENPSLLSQ
ncbi:TolC family protein [Desulfocurvus sp. DL9XJH121]